MPLGYLYAIGIGFFVLAVWWFLRETEDPARPINSIAGEPVKPRPKTRHQELTEARNNIVRQIEILHSPVGFRGRPNVEYELAELNALLAEIDEELTASP